MCADLLLDEGSEQALFIALDGEGDAAIRLLLQDTLLRMATRASAAADSWIEMLCTLAAGEMPWQNAGGRATAGKGQRQGQRSEAGAFAPDMAQGGMANDDIGEQVGTDAADGAARQASTSVSGALAEPASQGRAKLKPRGVHSRHTSLASNALV